MTGWIKKSLTRKLQAKGPRGRVEVQVEPSPKLVLLVKFALAMTGALCTLEVTSIIFLHVWNTEVFAGISGLTGTVTGVLIGRHV
jgi:hypothetical protein